MDNQPEILKQQYQLRFAELQGYRDQVWQVLCADYFARFIPREATILDLGAGWGEFVNHIDAARKFAMDLNPAVGSRLAPEVKLLAQDCSQPWALPEASLEVVFRNLTTGEESKS